MPSTKTLYRQVGLKEMALILQAEGEAFPPRLPEQPIFYPVLNRTDRQRVEYRGQGIGIRRFCHPV